MAKIVVGVFDHFLNAEDALTALQDAGIERNNISIVAAHTTSETTPATTTSSIAGAGTGALIGGIAGLVVGLAALAIPGIGPVIAAGPLLAALGIGAAAGGLIGALTGMNIPESDAQYYAEAVRRGGALVIVKAADEQAESVRELLNRNGARDIEERVAEWKSQGWRGYDAQPQTTEADVEQAELSRSSRPEVPQLTRTGARIYMDGLELDPRKSTFDDFKGNSHN